MTAAAAKQCGHAPCGCPVPPGNDYCCVNCANALGKTDCDCGHPECRAVAFKEERNDAKDQV